MMLFNTTQAERTLMSNVSYIMCQLGKGNVFSPNFFISSSAIVIISAVSACLPWPADSRVHRRHCQSVTLCPQERHSWTTDCQLCSWEFSQS